MLWGSYDGVPSPTAVSRLLSAARITKEVRKIHRQLQENKTTKSQRFPKPKRNERDRERERLEYRKCINILEKQLHGNYYNLNQNSTVHYTLLWNCVSRERIGVLKECWRTEYQIRAPWEIHWRISFNVYQMSVNSVMYMEKSRNIEMNKNKWIKRL